MQSDESIHSNDTTLSSDSGGYEYVNGRWRRDNDRKERDLWDATGMGSEL